MTNVVELKNVRCIEWNVQTSESGSTYVSEEFSIQDRKCHIELSIDTFKLLGWPSHVYFKSNVELQPPINVTILVAIASETLTSNWVVKPQSITGVRQEVWGTLLSGANYLWTFQLLIHADPSEESQPDTRTDIHLEALSRDFSKLLDETSSCDVEITCEDKTFKAHRIILETRSAVFSAMLKSDMVEGKTGLIKVEDITASIFKDFLHYLYSGMLPELSTIVSAKEFYEASDKYAVEELKKACSEYLTKNLSEDNACDLLVFADQHSDENFRRDIISYIVDKKNPRRDTQWSNFCKSYPNLAVEVQNLYIEKHCPE